MAHTAGTRLHAVETVNFEDESRGVFVTIPVGDVVTVASNEVTVGVNAENGHEVEYQLVTYRELTFEVPLDEFSVQNS